MSLRMHMILALGLLAVGNAIIVPLAISSRQEFKESFNCYLRMSDQIDSLSKRRYNEQMARLDAIEKKIEIMKAKRIIK